jgi:hypothetical protein
MGYYSELESRGFSQICSNRTVCAQCVSEIGLKIYIDENAESKECFYCDETSNTPFAVHLEELLPLIIEGLFKEWDDPNNCLPWDGREGGWQGADLADLADILGDELSGAQQELIDEIVEAIDLKDWCDRDPFGLNFDAMMNFNWKAFCYSVMHQNRFFFMGQQKSDYHNEQLSPDDIFSYIADFVQELGLIGEIAKGTIIKRARIVNADKEITSAGELSSPPIDCALYSNRMSPAGIPMFYGALNNKTAFLEIYSPDEYKDDDKKCVCGDFETKRELRVLDLSKKIEIPSIFIEGNTAQSRAVVRFMRSFTQNVSRAIQKDGKEHIEYVPTQVVTEYFRHVFRDEDGHQLDGITYSCSKDRKEKSIVLFLLNEDCEESDGPHKENSVLKLQAINEMPFSDCLRNYVSEDCLY